jgi:hypothetical protein
MQSLPMFQARGFPSLETNKFFEKAENFMKRKDSNKPQSG